MALLEGRNLRKTYRSAERNDVAALKGVDISIEPGEMVAIMGPSGSGKSTLMHVLGLLHAPDRNHGPAPELTFDGRDVAALTDGARTRIRAREMGFVFQDFNLVPTLTALENVMLAGEYAGVRGLPSRDRRARTPWPWSAWPTGRATGRRDVGRRAAARRHRPRPRQPALARPRRRADREPRLGARRRRPGPPAPAQRRARPDRSCSSPTIPRSARPATASCGCATAWSGAREPRRPPAPARP